MGVETLKPRFSYAYPQDTALCQETYRVMVATSKALIEKNAPDMWDSGIIKSPKNIGIEYNGKPLQSRTKYYVYCITADTNGNVYESEIATFEMALLNKEDWQGKWVGVPVNFSGGTLLFRKIINLPHDKKITRARAYVCGLGYHEFFVNGVKMGNSVLNPSVTEYSKRIEYCVYDMAGLTAGDNVIGVELGYGWFGTRKMLAQFYVEFEDGTVYEDHSAPVHGWWVTGSPTIDNGIYSGEVYDATLEVKYPKNWCTLAYEPTWANGWMYTIWASAPQGKLFCQQIEPIEVCDTYPEVKRTAINDKTVVVDIGANIAGWARIKVKGSRGAKVTLIFAEDVKKDGTANQLNLRSARCSDTYILSGVGEEEWAPRFTYHGFRYVQVEMVGKVELISLVGEHVHTNTKVVGAFECSNENLNKLHEIALRTEHNNEHSILTDCPQRDERFGWLNDLSARIYQTMYNVDMARFLPKFTRDITHTQSPEGCICDTAPYYTGSCPADPVSVIYLLMATYANRYYGDTHVAIEEYKNLKAWVDYLLSRSQNYIMDYSYYGDWVPPFEGIYADNIYVSTIYLLWHLREMSKVAQIAGVKKDSKKYAKMAIECEKALNKKYFDDKTCNYAKGQQTENALALSLGIVPKKYRQKVADNIYANVVKMNHHCTSGNIGYRHLFYVLADYGYADEVLEILLNPEYPGWGYMINNGATSVWERWEAEMQNEMHSFNHPMFGSYDAFLFAYLGGIKIDEDAYASNKVTIKPIFTQKLDYVTTSLQTLNGSINSAWKRENGVVTATITIPPMTTAKIIIGEKEYEVGAGVYTYQA